MRSLILVVLACVLLPVGLAGPMIAAEPAEKGEAAIPRLDCLYTPKPGKQHPEPELTPFEDCATLEDDVIRMVSPHLETLDFQPVAGGPHRLAVVLMASGWHYARPDGLAVRVLTLDNGPDDFTQGLARTRIDGKIAYLGPDLEIVIPPQWDFAWPFEDSLDREDRPNSEDSPGGKAVALVCQGCQGRRDGEHTAMVGGLWGYIDIEGNELVAVEHTDRADARAMLDP